MITATIILTTTLTGPAEDETVGDETLTVTLEDRGTADEDSFRYEVITVDDSDGCASDYEGFDDLAEAKAYYRERVAEIKRDHANNLSDRRMGHYEALSEISEDWTGMDHEVTQALARAIRNGRSADVLKALKAAGLA